MHGEHWLAHEKLEIPFFVQFMKESGLRHGKKSIAILRLLCQLP